MLSAGPIRTDPRPTPTTRVSARATTTTLATMPGRPRSRPVKPTDRAALGIARTDTYPPDGAGGIEMSGQIAEVSARSPAASRGPGRVISMSLTGRILSSLTAVITFQPGRAATAVGVGE